ncbi:hypothetical protein PVAND_010102 [Polypedilum vanderplanki]|uniref:Enoyl-CoA hydratase/isomerase n=1 Tax=Polypedilum vanderplanki TaxID=319348 RepID=A0A9J6CFM6_POLVA|nr:hypothetical protein PVAND_010102 [Polypedilum vanderplanki]
MEIFEVKDVGAIRQVTINNPRKKNALNRKAYIAIAKLLNDAGKDNKVKCLILTGKGDFFSSGNDLTQDFSDYPNDSIREQPVTIMIEAFIKFSKLLVALVNGPAIGIGTTMLGLCDIVYCSENAYFYTPFTALGLCAEGCSSQTFPIIMGQSIANEMLFLNKKMSAQEAYRVGFVAQIYKHESEIFEKLKGIETLSLSSIMANKKLMRGPLIENLMKVNLAEVGEIGKLFQSDEAIEAMIRFASRKSKL